MIIIHHYIHYVLQIDLFHTHIALNMAHKIQSNFYQHLLIKKDEIPNLLQYLATIFVPVFYQISKIYELRFITAIVFYKKYDQFIG